MKLPFSLIIEFAHQNLNEIESALGQFFGLKSLKNSDNDEDIFPLFSEWLIYDFKRPAGVSFINEYILKNPNKHPEKLLDQFSQASQTQLYSHYEILQVKKGEWIKVEDIFSGKTYRVYDKSSSKTIPKFGLLHSRIAKVDKRWYFVGANPFYFPITHTDRAKNIFRRDFKNKKQSPKDTAELLLNHPNYPDSDNIPNPPTKKELKNKLKRLRKHYNKKGEKYNLKLSFDQVADFIYQEDRVNVLDFWQELAKKGLGEKFIFTEIKLLEDMWNWLPHKCLGGKSPIEMYTKLKG